LEAAQRRQRLQDMNLSSHRMGAWGARLNAVVLAGALVMVIHSTASSTAPTDPVRSPGLAREAGDLSGRALQALIAGMDPAAAALAGRYDPAAPRKVEAHAPGWPTYDLSYTPLFDLQALEGDEARRINSLIPATSAPILPAKPFVLTARSTAERERAVRCLANAVYYEAALEPDAGQRAVAQVVLNRVRDPNFPKSVCGVVYEGWERTTGCQFSFTCNGALLSGPIPVLYSRARKVAEAALNGSVMTEVGSATHYHADYVAPYWAPTLNKLGQIGQHIFYRWPGSAGEVAAFTGRYRGGELALSEAVLTGRAPRPNLDPAESSPPAVQLLLASASATPAPEATVQLPGRRRKATPEEIARINDLLAKSFPIQPSTTAPAAPAAAPSETVTTAPSPNG
jgi:spore germination cell wall hydrolase CwlJ-like protein